MLVLDIRGVCRGVRPVGAWTGPDRSQNLLFLASGKKGEPSLIEDEDDCAGCGYRSWPFPLVPGARARSRSLLTGKIFDDNPSGDTVTFEPALVDQ